MNFKFNLSGTILKNKIKPPEGVLVQFVEKGSYRLEQMLKTIEQLPNRASPFTRLTGQNFGVYMLDDYTVHLMPEVKKALLKRGYIPVIIGGGITGINFTKL